MPSGFSMPTPHPPIPRHAQPGKCPEVASKRNAPYTPHRYAIVGEMARMSQSQLAQSGPIPRPGIAYQRAPLPSVFHDGSERRPTFRVGRHRTRGNRDRPARCAKVSTDPTAINWCFAPVAEPKTRTTHDRKTTRPTGSRCPFRAPHTTTETHPPDRIQVFQKNTSDEPEPRIGRDGKERRPP